MKKRRKKKRKRGQTIRSRPKVFPATRDDLDDSTLYTISYEITSEPILEEAFQRLPRSVKKRFEELHKMIYAKPKEAIPELIELKKKYPYVPVFYNHLTLALSKIGRDREAEAVSRECLQRRPDYLFARINMAEFYLMRGEYEKIAELFDHTYDLGLLYPERDVFHISEAVGFFGIIGMYLAKTGQTQAAEIYLEMLQEMAPGEPLTKRLKRELHPGPLARLARRLAASQEKEDAKEGG